MHTSNSIQPSMKNVRHLPLLDSTISLELTHYLQYRWITLRAKMPLLTNINLLLFLILAYLGTTHYLYYTCTLYYLLEWWNAAVKNLFYHCRVGLGLHCESNPSLSNGRKTGVRVCMCVCGMNVFVRMELCYKDHSICTKSRTSHKAIPPWPARQKGVTHGWIKCIAAWQYQNSTFGSSLFLKMAAEPPSSSSG